jgi:hypothetical protein
VAVLGAASARAEDGAAPAGRLVELARRADLAMSLRGGYWSSSRRLDDEGGLGSSSVWLRAAPRLGPHVALAADGWVGADTLDEGSRADGRLREAYAHLAVGRLDLRAGKQIIAWGRADRINPTDNLSPRDFTLLTPEEDDQRFGTGAVRATYDLGPVSVIGVWLPDFEPHVIPLHPPPAGVALHEREPGNTHGQWAAKVERRGEGLDWSLSYFDGFDLFPDLGIERVAPSGVDLELRSHRLRVLGADAAAVLGPYGLRAEAAYAHTEDADGRDPFVKNPYAWMVVGADRTFLETLNVNVQYLLRVVTRYRDPNEIDAPLARAVALREAVIANQLDRLQQGASVRLAQRWLRDALEAEVRGVLLFPRGDYAVRPQVSYAFTDYVKAIVGGDLFQGRRDSFLGNLRDNSGLYVELRWAF